MELVAEGFINRCIGNAPSIFVSICCIVSRSCHVYIICSENPLFNALALRGTWVRIPPTPFVCLACRYHYNDK